jgi:hypothetical protein
MLAEQSPALNTTTTKLRFAWLLPCAQLVLCAALLWPVRLIIFIELHIHLSPVIGKTMYPDYVRWAPRKDFFLGSAAMLNMPAGAIQLPYAIFFSPDKTEWNPSSAESSLWRAVTWPFLCLPFWWIAGRAVDALVAIKNGKYTPRIGWTETILGFLLLATGAIAFAGLLFGLTEADKNFELIPVLAGCGLWTMLGSLSVIARFRQWRLRKKITASQPLNTILPNASSG